MPQTLIPFDFKTWRESKKHNSLPLTQDQLASMLHISRQQLARVEKRGSGPMLYIWAYKGLEAAFTGAQNG